MSSQKKVFLIGLPGTGKSHYGKIVAEKMKIPFLDLDDIIEKNQSMTISEIFKTKGESTFRDIEQLTLKRVTEDNLAFILATGGGTPCFYEGIDYMKKNGVVVFIDEADDIIISRLTESSDRPLVSSDAKGTIAELRRKRQATYEQAHIITMQRDVDLLTEQINKIKS